MKEGYEDIINLKYPYPTGHEKMSMAERAAQFSPFAALTGYDDLIREEARYVDDEIKLSHPERSEELDMSEIESDVRNSAQKIIAAKKATYYGIGMALARITRAIFSDEHSILTISSLVDGEYGIKDTYLGLPCIVGRKGRVKLLELDLNAEEREKLKKSASIIKGAYDSIKF